MDATPRIIYICLNFLNIFLHGVGFSLLLHLYRRGQRSSQRLYLLNLSLAEIVQNALRLTIHALVLQRAFNTHSTIGKIGHCVLNVANTGVYYLVFMSVFLLTGDRLLCVGMRYTKVWTLAKCLNIIKVTWASNLVVSVAMFLYTFFHEGSEISRRVDIILTIYVPTTLFVTFLIFAVITYTIMFCQFVSSSRQTQQRGMRTSTHGSVVYTFRQSKFFMSLIIISSFLVLMVIPGLVATFTIIGGRPLEKWYEIYLNISVTLNDTADVLIYVFFQPDVKRLLVANVSCICRRYTKDQYVVNSRTTFEISGTPRNSHVVAHTMSATMGGLTASLIPPHHQNTTSNDFGSIKIMKLNIPSTHEDPEKYIPTLQRQRNDFHKTTFQRTDSHRTTLQKAESRQYSSELSPLGCADCSSSDGESFSEEPFDRVMVLSSMSLRLPPYPLLSTFGEYRSPLTPTQTLTYIQTATQTPTQAGEHTHTLTHEETLKQALTQTPTHTTTPTLTQTLKQAPTEARTPTLTQADKHTHTLTHAETLTQTLTASPSYSPIKSPKTTYKSSLKVSLKVPRKDLLEDSVKDSTTQYVKTKKEVEWCEAI